MSTFGGIEIGKRSLMAHNQLINTAGHNISNADTEGYSRQRVTLGTFEPLYRPDLTREETPGQIGQGVNIESISRVRDEQLDQRITAQASDETYWQTRDKYYMMIEQIYNEPEEVSIRTSMDKFWDAWQELSMYPGERASRQAIVIRGESLTNSIQQREKSLEGIGNLLNSDIEATVKQVNDYAKQIAALNDQIVESKGLGDNPNDLMDRRDKLVDDLSKLINITTSNRDSDEFMVHTDGRILVQGHIARGFNVEPVIDNDGYSKVVWNDTGVDAHFEKGSLGALIELRDSDIRSERQSLDTMTMNFADLVNDVHRNAVGANNVKGLDFFTQQPFVTNVNGNYDRSGDGVEDTSYVFRFTGTNELAKTAQIGIDGVMQLSGRSGNVSVPYYSTDTVEAVINRINDSDAEVKAYLDRNNHLALKATTAANIEDPDFVIRHVEDSGFFLTGYAGILSASGEEGAYDFAQADAVNALNGAQFAVAPVKNPSSYIAINSAITADVNSVAAALPNAIGFAEAGDNRAAVEIAAIRNSAVMIGKDRTFDDYFANSVTNVGLRGEQAANNVASQNAIMSDLRSLRDSISGVNIDEELADIIKFQHGYNAAAKIVTVMDSLIDTVINRLGV